MEQPQGINQQTPNLPFTKMTIFLGLVVTFNIMVNVLLRWRNYNLLNKSLGVVLLANMVLSLVHVFLQRKGRKKLQPDLLLQLSYVCLLLATVVFNPH